MTYKNQVIGGGGGGKGGSARAASEAPNTLRSKQIAHIIDLLGEGEWEGLVDGPGGIYLNNVALFTPDAPTGDVVSIDLADSDDSTWTVPGTWNFKGVTVEFRNGTQSQTAIREGTSASLIQAVNLPVVHATPVVTNVTNPNVDTCVVNVQVDQLYQQDTSNGDISGFFVDVEIQARHGSGSWTSIKTDRIEGKAMSPYVRGYSVDLHAIDPTGPWDVRVLRVSADDPDSSKHSLLTFVGLDLISRNKFRYPNSVLASIGVDASQLSAVPDRSYDCKMLRVRVPNNYNPVTRVYTGVWDGTFTVAWSDNPAWCLYDMITSPRYGLGDYVDDDMTDKWALYTIGRYCDALVPDGFGGTEPRFRLNCYFQTADEAITVLQNLSSAFRSILYYLNESLTALQDSPSDSVYQFNQSNVVDGIFSYAGASGSTRHTVAMVVWNNPEIGYKQDVEVAEDPAGLLRFGFRPVTVQAVGCTSRGQAHRLGLWTLFVEQYEANILSFSTALEGTGVQPGNVIDVFDPLRANISLGGRVLGTTGQTVHLDRAIALPAGTHTMSFVADDGTLASRAFTVGSGTFSDILLDGSGAVPSKSSVYGVQTSTVMSQQFRIVSITESDRHKYDITAIAYNASKYAYVEDGLALNIRPTRASMTPESAPTNPVFTESLYLLADGSIRNRLVVSWDQNPWAIGYIVSQKVGSGNWSPEETVPTNQITLSSVVEGWTYSFRVSVLSMGNVRGAQAEWTYVVLGAKAPPPPFDEFSFVQQSDGTSQISYGYTVTEKPLDYLGAQIRNSLDLTATWDDMVPVAAGFFTYSPVEGNGVPAGTYRLGIKAEDMTHSLSTPLYIVAVVANRFPADVISAMADDNMLSRGEKLQNHLFFEQIVKFHDAIVAQATALGITTELTNFAASYTELGRYLSAVFDPATGDGVGLGGTDWLDATTDSIIDGTVFRAKFFDVFAKAQILADKVTAIAQATADDAVGRVAMLESLTDAWAADNVLSEIEKPACNTLKAQIDSFYTQKEAQATAVGITTERTNFVTAYNALNTYLTAIYNGGTLQGVGTGGTDWSDVTTNSTIDGATFRAKFDAVFTTGDILDRKITEVAQATANTAQTGVNSLNALTTAWAADNVLSMIEKPANNTLKAQIDAFYTQKEAEATSVGITTERTNFVNAYNALNTYLTAIYNGGTLQGVGTGGTDWADVTTNSTIDGATFRAKFASVFSTAEILARKLTDVAQTAANTAQTGVNSLNSLTTAWAADNVLSEIEKPSNNILKAQIDSFYTQKEAEATAAGITTERTNFVNAYNALNTYLTAVYNGGTLQGVGTGGTDWADVTTNSTIDGTTFRAKFASVFSTADILVRKLTDVAATKATWTGVTGSGKPADNADVTVTILQNSGTSVLMASSTLFKTTTGLGGVFVGGGGIFGKNGSGVVTFSIDGATGAATFSGDITGGANINITGSAIIGGNFVGVLGFSQALQVNGSGVSTYGVVAVAGSGGAAVVGEGASDVGLYGRSVSSVAVRGQILSNGQGIAVSGEAGTNVLAVGVSASHSSSSGVALRVGVGVMTIQNSTLITNLNANYLNGNADTQFFKYTGTVDTGNPGTPTHGVHAILSGVALIVPVII